MDNLTIDVECCPWIPGKTKALTFEARLDGRLLCTSGTPFLDSARVLLAEGHGPTATLVMMRGEVESLRGPLGYAASRTVAEAHGAPRFGKWTPYPGRSAFTPTCDGAAPDAVAAE
jgi:hypothetical protein